jgi:hypothetical protein
MYIRRSISVRRSSDSPLVRAFNLKRFVVETLVPTAAALALSSPVEAASLTLEWDPPDDPEVVGYIVSYGSTPGDYGTQLNVGLVSRVQVSGLAERSSYCFAVRAYNSLGILSGFSNSVCGTTTGTTEPGSTSTLTVNRGGDLQAALDAAKPGETILLEAGATFVGNFVLPAKSGDATSYITIRSSAADASLPAEGVRMTPSYASQLAKLQSPNEGPALSTEAGAHHYRLQFLEFAPNAENSGAIIALGDGSELQDTLDEVPHHLTLDRVYIHGDATRGQVRGIELNSASTEILNSHISEIKAMGLESQAIASWNGPGPYLIFNNHLEAAGQNVLIGARAPSIPSLVPSEVTLRRNLVTKQLAWRFQPWAVDDLVELRNAEYVIVDGNVLENTWLSSQQGYAIVIRTANTADTPVWSSVYDVELTNNIVRNVSAGLYVGRDATGTLSRVTEIAVRNNFFEKINRVGGLGVFLNTLGVPDVSVDHNTVVNDGYFGLLASTWPSERLTFTNNVMVDRGSAILGAGAVAGLDSISRYFPRSEFFGGIFIGGKLKLVGNYFPRKIAAVGFVNYPAGNYRLSATSIYKRGATDGSDPGCDFDELERAQR